MKISYSKLGALDRIDWMHFLSSFFVFQLTIIMDNMVVIVEADLMFLPAACLTGRQGF